MDIKQKRKLIKQQQKLIKKNRKVLDKSLIKTNHVPQKVEFEQEPIEHEKDYYMNSTQNVLFDGMSSILDRNVKLKRNYNEKDNNNDLSIIKGILKSVFYIIPIFIGFYVIEETLTAVTSEINVSSNPGTQYILPLLIVIGVVMILPIFFRLIRGDEYL